MKVATINSSPNLDGLNSQILSACEKVIVGAGHEFERVNLNKYDIKHCLMCGRGWGICKEKNKCVLGDDFESIKDKLAECDMFIFSTPVYFWEMSEITKTFFDRLKRVCWTEEKSRIKGKPVINIAIAGGSGSGRLETIEEMKIQSRFLGFNNIENYAICREDFEEKQKELINLLKIILIK